MADPHQAPPRVAVSRELAAFAAASRLEEIPAPVRAEARRALVNWLGCVLGGAHHPAILKAAGVLASASALRDAQFLGHEQRVDAMLAALLNSMSASVHVFDDNHPTTVAHPGSPVIAAGLAVAERSGATGAEFLHAILLGIEVTCRVSKMLVIPPAKSHLGLFMTGLAGGIGGAVAAGKLLGLSPRQLTWAMGTAATQAAGLRAVHGTDSTSFMAGAAARAGATAALLAEAGFTSSETALEGARGFADVYATAPNLEAALEGLGSDFELSTLTYKPYPCGIVAHAPIDVCLELAARPGVSVEAIERVSLRVHPVALQLTGIRHPRDGMQSHNSLFHWAAAALARKSAGLDEETDEAIADPVLRGLRDLVTAEAEPSFSMDQCEGELQLRDGTVHRVSVDHCRGSVERPLTNSELDAKFLAQAVPLLGEAASRRALESCWNIDAVEAIGELTARTVPQRDAALS